PLASSSDIEACRYRNGPTEVARAARRKSLRFRMAVVVSGCSVGGHGQNRTADMRIFSSPPRRRRTRPPDSVTHYTLPRQHFGRRPGAAVVLVVGVCLWWSGGQRGGQRQGPNPPTPVVGPSAP